MVAIGASGSSGNLIPATGGNADGSMVTLADGDLVLFIAARFAATNWGDTAAPFPYALGAGSYSASLYVELIHE